MCVCVCTHFYVCGFLYVCMFPYTYYMCVSMYTCLILLFSSWLPDCSHLWRMSLKRKLIALGRVPKAKARPFPSCLERKICFQFTEILHVKWSVTSLDHQGDWERVVACPLSASWFNPLLQGGAWSKHLIQAFQELPTCSCTASFPLISHQRLLAGARCALPLSCHSVCSAS